MTSAHPRGETGTGRGGDIIIIDDPIKPDEAMSEITRKNVNDWFSTTLASRLDDKENGAIICVMQRLHQYDLAGMLIEQGGWDHLSLPAIATQDAIIPLRRHHRGLVRRSWQVLCVRDRLVRPKSEMPHWACRTRDPRPRDRTTPSPPRASLAPRPEASG